LTQNTYVSIVKIILLEKVIRQKILEIFMGFTSRQQNIINASLKIISSLGIQNFTIKNLAKELNVTEGAIYRHFESKEQIIAAIVEFSHQFTKQKIDANYSSPNTSMEKLKYQFIDRVEGLKENKSLLILSTIMSLHGDDPKIKAAASFMIKYYYDILLKIVHEGQEAGGIRKDIPAEHILDVMLGTLRGIINKWETSGFNFDIVKEAEELWSSLELVFTACSI
jgi:AcrR family transcriptional regulator